MRHFWLPFLLHYKHYIRPVDAEWRHLSHYVYRSWVLHYLTSLSLIDLTKQLCWSKWMSSQSKWKWFVIISFEYCLWTFVFNNCIFFYYGNLLFNKFDMSTSKWLLEISLVHFSENTEVLDWMVCCFLSIWLNSFDGYLSKRVLLLW